MFDLTSEGALDGPPRTFLEYIGTGKATACGMAAGPDGLYFTDLYTDASQDNPIAPGANVLRVRYVGAVTFSTNVVEGTAPLSVQFSDTSDVQSPTAWFWDFGDGTTSPSRNPTHTYTSDGTYTVRLSVSGANGIQTTVQENIIRVGSYPRIAFIGDAPPISGDDSDVISYLIDAGYAVDSFFDEPSARPSAQQIADNYELVVVSSTVLASNIGGDFRTLGVPMIFYEPGLLQPGREELSRDGVVLNNITTINVVNNTHPVMAGLPLGNVQVTNIGQLLGFGGQPVGQGAQVLATLAGNAARPAVMIANPGAQLVNGYVAPARRVFLFYGPDSFSESTPLGRQLLLNSVCWALQGSTSIAEQPQNDSAPLGGVASFSVRAAGVSPFGFQWQFNGQNLSDGPRPGGSVVSGAQTARLQIANVRPGDVGTYRCFVTGLCGSVQSSGALLTITVSVCDSIDFNGDGLFPDVQDITDFISIFAGGTCAPPNPAGCNIDIDFNNDGLFPDTLDITSFLSVFAGGPCL
jgi:PKD repeat protein